MSRLLVDVRYAFRSLRKVPLFSAIAIASIGLGIGANTTVFTLVDQVVVRLLPVVRPGELVQVSAPGTESYGGSMGDTELSYAMYRDIRDRNQVFAGTACRMAMPINLSDGTRSELVNGDLVSGNFFSLLGLNPALGRLIDPQDDRLGDARAVAVLSHAYWKSRFGGDPGIVGRMLRINGYSYQVIGVVDPRFAGLDIGQPAQAYLPITMQPRLGPAWLQLEGRRFRFVQIYARLKAGVSAAQAQAGLQPLYHAVLEQEAADAAFAQASADVRRQFLAGTVTVADASRGHSRLRESVTAPLLILMAIAAAVLLIVCANLANLLIARGAARHRELALRLAVGASRTQIVRLLLVESLILALVGAAIGVLLSVWGTNALLAFFASPDAPLPISAAPDGRILLFTSVLAVFTAMLAGAVPAFRSTSVDLAPTLKSSGGAVVNEQPRLRKTLLVAQVALSFLLLIGAGLFMRSLRNLMAVDPGFKTSHVMTFALDTSRAAYNAERSHTFWKALAQRLAHVPGVTATGFAFMPLLQGAEWGMDFTVEGYQPPRGQSAGSACNAISPGFFKAMGVPLVAGREFTERDDRILPAPEGWPYRHAIVNETFAKRYFTGVNPIGRHVGIGADPGTAMPIEIVGLVKDTRYAGIREEQRPQIFFPYLEAGQIENLTVYARTEADPDATAPLLRREVAALDAQMPIFNMATLESRVERSVVNERLIATLSTALSGMATLLSVIGLYGVMTYMVTRRTREIGIRMALGALEWQIARSVLQEAGVLVGVGLAAGFVAAWWLGRYVESQLYGVTPADGVTIALAAIVLTLAATLAATVPARRAARVSPMTALREE
jgi:predicted permease